MDLKLHTEHLTNYCKSIHTSKENHNSTKNANTMKLKFLHQKFHAIANYTLQ